MIKEYNKPQNIVYITCHKVAIDLGFNIFKEDIDGGEIKFKVPMSIWSFGEKFKILITQINQSKTTVEVASDAVVGLQIIDWGKNNKNIMKFFETLNNMLEK